MRRRVVPPVSPPPVRGLDDLVEILRNRRGGCDEALLGRVWEFAEETHRGQNRLSGDSFATHPLAVAYLLGDLGFDETSAVVALLHDTVEDAGVELGQIAAEFGEEVSELVDGVTKIGRHAYVRRDEVQAETFRKLLLASARDVRVILVKLADRLHNMMTLEHLPAEDRRRIALETLEIYAPIAHRLGMARVKGDLEDLAFFHLWPRQWAELYGEVQRRLKGGRRLMQRLVGELEQRLRGEQIEAAISYRVKRMWSIYQKLRRQGIDISQLYDYLAVRIVTTTRGDTYRALGVVHERWRPVPGRFKDYLAMPKPNGYRSLHTTVIGDHGQPFEVQIRTGEMDEIAERGIAAHWAYKEPATAAADENVRWLRRVVEWQGEVADPRTFLASLKMDLYPDEVYVFTPKGEVHALPRGATPVDFAYRVHSEIGDHCAGARVNGRTVALGTRLRNGDQVEIVVEPTRSPQREWLSFVATPRAKARIRQRLNLDARRRARDLGARLLEQEAKRAGTSSRRVLEAMAAQTGSGFLAEDQLARIGWGRTSARALVAASGLAGQPRGRLGSLVERFRRSAPDLIAAGVDDDLLVRRATCCAPLPGDEIVGVVSRRRGVEVHRRGCAVLAEAADLEGREVEVTWSKSASGPWPVALSVATREGRTVASQITAAVAKSGVELLGFVADPKGTSRAEIRVAVGSRVELEAVEAALRALDVVSEVLRAERATVAGAPLRAPRPRT